MLILSCSYIHIINIIIVFVSLSFNYIYVFNIFYYFVFLQVLPVLVTESINKEYYRNMCVFLSYVRTTHTSLIKPQKRTSSFATNTSYIPAQCVMCNGNHKLFMCRQFKDCSVLERVKYVTDNKPCSVCYLLIMLPMCAG